MDGERKRETGEWRTGGEGRSDGKRGSKSGKVNTAKSSQ